MVAVKVTVAPDETTPAIETADPSVEVAQSADLEVSLVETAPLKAQLEHQEELQQCLRME
tara:strand:+ start:443 stop:622 length:180 start_codon:yes stop_codon:yes gene_type:complete